MLEPSVTSPNNYEWLKQNYHLFDMVLTHDESIIKECRKAVFCPNAMSWVSTESFSKDNSIKSKNISIIASNKNKAPGHQLRHQLISILKDRNLFDIYGTGYKPVEYKYEALKDYRFSVAIENCRLNHYFSEKLIDCFLVRSIPVYWGCPEVNKFFNPDGILQCNNIGDFIRIINAVNADGINIYESKKKAIEENFNLAKGYLSQEDWIYQNVILNKLYNLEEYK